MKDKILVNYASFGREDYPSVQPRLIKSFQDTGWDGDYLMVSPQARIEHGVEISIHPPIRPHSEVPYGFKPDLISYVWSLGYKQIIWADSTIKALRPLDELWNIAHIRGVVAFHNLGHDLHKYISDQAAARLKILDSPDFEKITQIMACSILFDFSNPVGRMVFHEWYEASITQGMFQDGGSPRHDFRSHRHDQAILSALLWKYEVPLCPYGDLVYEPHDQTKEYGDPYLLNKGI